MKFTWKYERTISNSLRFETFIDDKKVEGMRLEVFCLSGAVGRFVVKWMLEFCSVEDKEFQAELYPANGNLYLTITTEYGSITFEATNTIKRHYEEAVAALKSSSAPNHW
jgi:hypothetical protein